METVPSSPDLPSVGKAHSPHIPSVRPPLSLSPPGEPIGQELQEVEWKDLVLGTTNNLQDKTDTSKTINDRRRCGWYPTGPVGKLRGGHPGEEDHLKVVKKPEESMKFEKIHCSVTGSSAKAVNSMTEVSSILPDFSTGETVSYTLGPDGFLYLDTSTRSSQNLSLEEGLQESRSKRTASDDSYNLPASKKVRKLSLDPDRVKNRESMYSSRAKTDKMRKDVIELEDCVESMKFSVVFKKRILDDMTMLMNGCNQDEKELFPGQERYMVENKAFQHLRKKDTKGRVTEKQSQGREVLVRRAEKANKEMEDLSSLRDDLEQKITSLKIIHQYCLRLTIHKTIPEQLNSGLTKEIKKQMAQNVPPEVLNEVIKNIDAAETNYQKKTKIILEILSIQLPKKPPENNIQESWSPSLDKLINITRSQATLNRIGCPKNKGIQKLTLDEGQVLASDRLRSINFILSPSQPQTPGDGDCLFHGLQDQCNYHGDLRFFSSFPAQLRSFLTALAVSQIQEGEISWSGEESVDDWRRRMETPGEMGDQVVLQVAANTFKRDIVVIPVFREDATNQSTGQTVISPSTAQPEQGSLYLLYYSETRFALPHYQSIRPARGNTVSVIQEVRRIVPLPNPVFYQTPGSPQLPEHLLDLVLHAPFGPGLEVLQEDQLLHSSLPAASPSLPGTSITATKSSELMCPFCEELILSRYKHKCLS